MVSTTSLKLPEDLKSRAVTLAADKGMSTHAYLVEAIRKTAEAEERQREFLADADQAWRETQQTGKVYAAADVHEFFLRRAKGEAVGRPKPIKQPTQSK